MKVNILKSPEAEKRERERKFKEMLKETKDQKKDPFESRKKKPGEYGF